MQIVKKLISRIKHEQIWTKRPQTLSFNIKRNQIKKEKIKRKKATCKPHFFFSFLLLFFIYDTIFLIIQKKNLLMILDEISYLRICTYLNPLY